MYVTHTDATTQVRCLWIALAIEGHPVRYGWRGEHGTWEQGEITAQRNRVGVGTLCDLGEHHPTEIYPAATDLASALWVQATTGEAQSRLARFSVRPTFVYRHGKTVRHTAVWALRSPLPHRWIKRANERLASALDCPRKFADPHGFSFPPPGSRWRADGKQSTTTLIEHNATALYEAAEVVGKDRPGGRALPEPPAIRYTSWRQAA